MARVRRNLSILKCRLATSSAAGVCEMTSCFLEKPHISFFGNVDGGENEKDKQEIELENQWCCRRGRSNPNPFFCLGSTPEEAYNSYLQLEVSLNLNFIRGR